MTTQEELLAEIATYVAARGITESTFGRLSVNDWGFVERLRSKGNITLATVNKVRSYIRDNPATASAA